MTLPKVAPRLTFFISDEMRETLAPRSKMRTVASTGITSVTWDDKPNVER